MRYNRHAVVVTGIILKSKTQSLDKLLIYIYIYIYTAPPLVMFSIQELTTVTFNHHYHSYIVRESDRFILVECS